MLLWILLASCAASRTVRSTGAHSDSTKTPVLPVDPWSLGPDVFTISRTTESGDSEEVATYTPVEATISSIPDGSLSTLDSVVEAQPDSNEIELQGTSSPANAVSIEPAPPITARPAITFTVQLGTFLDRNKAQEFYDKAAAALGIGGTILSDWPFYRLRFGEFENRDSADSLYRVSMSRGFYDARVLKQTTLR